MFAFLYLRLIAWLGVGCIVGLWFVDLDLVVGLVVLPISGCRGVGWLGLVGDLSVYGCWWDLVCYSLYLFLCLLVSGFVLLVHRFGLGV